MKAFTFPSLVCGLLLLTACSSEKKGSQAPEGIIPVDSFAYIVGELQIVNIVKRQAGRLENVDSLQFEKYALQACEAFNISSERYESSYNYYLTEMDTMEVILEKALVYLEEKDIEVKTTSEEKKD